MRVIWLCNMMPGAVRASLGGSADGGLWVDHVLSDLRQETEITLRIFCPGSEIRQGNLDDRTDFVTFTEGLPYVYLPELEAAFARQLQDYQPDVIHIWGTEYGHTLAMVNAAKSQGMEHRIAVSIQGLCGPYAPHYAEGLPKSVIHGYTFRDLLRRDNIAQQQQKFVLRGKLERQALEQVNHVIGRTDWDRDCTAEIRPDRVYHFCNETLREAFYRDTWSWDSCCHHRIFASSCLYPIKGFHYLLEAMPAILAKYPDATISVTGDSFFPHSLSDSLRQESYTRYLVSLCRRCGLEDKIDFLGRLNEEGMKQAFLQANVFALPSTIENSPNSLGEAMLLGVPCVAADVGGVSNMMNPGEGCVYSSDAPQKLGEYILKVFDQGREAETMGAAARAHALKTHDPATNLQTLLNIYETVANA